MNIPDAAIRLFAVVSGINVVANLDNRRFFKAIAVTKPLLMPLLILFHATSGRPLNWPLMIALFFGFLGDVFLLIPGEKEKFFMAGLGSFLVNQILYVVIFSLSIGGLDRFLAGGEWWLLLLAIPYLAYGIVFYRILSPKLGPLKIPVIVYMTVILLMGITALLRGAQCQGPAFWLVLAGSLSFVVSDSILAYDRFQQRIPRGQALVMATYIVAQLLIVLGLMES